MLRITTTETEQEQTWILHGQISGPWVAELQASWNLSAAKKQKRVVDLTDVTFVDEVGASVLREMKAAGAKFIARGVDTKQLLNDLNLKTAPALRRCLSCMFEREKR
jgi:anti-anti-sigma regulatory factor